MALPLIAAGIAFAAPIIADLIGRALSAGDREQAQKYMDEALAQYGPDILKAPGVADLTAVLPPSQLASATADPGSIAAQRSALANLQRRGEQGPENIEFRAGMDAAARAANQQAAGQNALLRNEMQARGRGNTGAEYAVRALENQQAAERASAGGFAAAAEGNRSALQALQAGGSLAGTMRGQSFNEAATRARAADETARFNEENRVKGQAMAFDAQMGLSNARAGALSNAANIKSGQAAQTQQFAGNVGAGIGQGAGTLGMYFDSQRNKPKGGG